MSEQLCLALLRDCRTLNGLKQIHAFASKTGLERDPLISGKLLLLSSVSIANALDYARRLLFHIPSPDVFMYNTFIRGLSESETPQNSLLTYIDMCRRTMPTPDSFTFAFILKATANYKSLAAGVQLHCQSLIHGLDTHIFVRTTLISMYAECGCIVSARKAFDELHQPNIVAWNAIVTACFRCSDIKGAEITFKQIPFKNLMSWNIMLAGYMKSGELELARSTFSDMPVKDSVSWSTMIIGFSHNGCLDEPFRYFRELQRLGMRPNEVSLTGVLSACAQAGAFEFGKILHSYIEKVGYNWIVSVSNALLDTYAKCGNVKMARLIFDQMIEKSIVSWTSMIAGFAMHGYGEEAIELFHKMEDSGIRPDGITFISILYACSHAGLIEQGCRYFNKMEETYGIEPSIEHYGCMVDLYGRAGLLHEAYKFINGMPIEATAIIWRTLLGACSIHGNVRLAEKVKERLSELEPDNSGDHVLLSNIYAVAGKWKDVITVRRSMADRKIKKAPGWSMIEVDKVMYSFVVGEGLSEVAKEAYEKLGEIMLRLKVEGGYIPEVGSVLHDIEDEEKEDAVSRHSEKLAVAFGISRLCQESIIRIVKNLRVCKDCHIVMKLISKVYRREIVVRDRSRFHSFRDGSCSCRDYW
ncbi:pentatricopeptide repeat-containing protein At1g74630 [Macadamia integrifolia]|uniref:pentatricopeptide repeat-containing protein At1g74630 n=1 Tax=Macadamia integrifolia TaxID=60698 RepID=UPI001C4E8CF6|nr:pentatricopeptide repeat-containing protein At1g74630 [Macadamia integrifolia]